MAEDVAACIAEFKDELEIYQKYRCDRDKLSQFIDAFRLDYPQFWYVDFPSQY